MEATGAGCPEETTTVVVAVLVPPGFVAVSV